VRADYANQEHIGARLLELGHRADDPAFRLSGLMMLAPAAINKGRFEAARALLEEAMTIADSLETAALVDTFGQNQQVTPRGFLAWVLSLLGDEDRARELTEEALSRARRLPNPLDEAFALFFDAFRAVIAGDARSARGRADELLALCAEHGLALFSAMGTMLRGWALAAQGEPRPGAAIVEEGLVAFEATGARMMLHCFLALLAEALQQGGQIEKALIAVEAGLSKVDPTTCFYEAALHRLKGELLAAADSSGRPEAEAELRTAIAIARAQNATPLQLRAQSSLHALLGQ
jgi:predicted ATPase